MNHSLPEKVHEAVIKIHQLIFRNMKLSVEGNINDYIKMFGEDLGVYSVSLLPHFVHTSNFEQRVMVLRILNNYYLDLGKELIPMLPGILKALLAVYSTTINTQLIALLELTLSKLLTVVGRRYVVGCTWSLILKYRDCKQSGIKFLSKVIDRMEYIKGEEEFEEERGFEDLEMELLEEAQLDAEGTPESRGSHEQVLKHLNQQEASQGDSPFRQTFEQDSNSIPLSSPNQTPGSPSYPLNSPIDRMVEPSDPTSAAELL